LATPQKALRAADHSHSDISPQRRTCARGLTSRKSPTAGHRKTTNPLSGRHLDWHRLALRCAATDQRPEHRLRSQRRQTSFLLRNNTYRGCSNTDKMDVVQASQLEILKRLCSNCLTCVIYVASIYLLIKFPCARGGASFACGTSGGKGGCHEY